ncbi:hypothetical protein QTJ16_006757 [Diplocarpon rosae]|uniref:Uncharacterized protein n=1 Tax=Diplocarpon rosae TaxID=946125 RepID=A0AAD9WBG8_9HELO|nr:hypothetical protein QTJ16_006757 [Diplocarpon rosae]
MDTSIQAPPNAAGRHPLPWGRGIPAPTPTPAPAPAQPPAAAAPLIPATPPPAFALTAPLPAAAVLLPAAPFIARVMPPRATHTTAAALPFFFDLPNGAGLLTPIVPAKNARDAPNALAAPKNWKMPPDCERFLAELVKLAVLLLRRKLTSGDFLAITEALNRRFRGLSVLDGSTPPRPVPFFERAWNPMDTKVRHKTNAPGYAAMEAGWLASVN